MRYARAELTARRVGQALFAPRRVEAWDALGPCVVLEANGGLARLGARGRALGQLRRLEQGMRLAENRTVILEWLRAEPALTLDALAAKLVTLSPRAAPTAADAHYQAKQHLKQLYRSMHDQGLIEANELGALARFTASQDRGGRGRAVG